MLSLIDSKIAKCRSWDDFEQLVALKANPNVSSIAPPKNTLHSYI